VRRGKKVSKGWEGSRRERVRWGGVGEWGGVWKGRSDHQKGTKIRGVCKDVLYRERRACEKKITDHCPAKTQLTRREPVKSS